MKFEVDEELCIGCGVCAEMAPDVFDMEDDVAKVIVDPVPEEFQEVALEAKEACPVEAISHE